MGMNRSRNDSLDSPDSFDEWIDRVCDADPPPLHVEDPRPPPGPPLSANECRAAWDQLAAFQTPADFIKLTKTLCDRCGSEDWFNRPHLKFLHDAYVLAEFVRLAPVQTVRLAGSSEQWPDGHVTVAGNPHKIEITSTHGGRKLGEEYRGIQTMRMDPVENWVARANSIPDYLRQAIEAKSKKLYGSRCWLVVYRLSALRQ
jgi:hypothetical protein